MLSGPGERVHPSFYLLMGALGVLVFLVVAPLWSAIFGGLLLGYFSYPAYERVRDRVERPGAAAGLTLAGLSVLVLVPGGYLGYVMVLEASDLVRTVTAQDVQMALTSFAEFTNAWLGWPEVTPGSTPGEALAADLVPRLRQAVGAWLPNAASFLAGFTVAATIVVFVAYYTLKDGEAMVDFVLDLSPFPEATEERIVGDIGRALDAVVFGQVATALVQGVLAGLGFWVLGVPSPVLLGFVSAVLSILPVIGPFLVWLPASVYLLSIGRTGAGVALFLWGLLVVSTADHVIRSTLISSRGNMHPTIALVGVLGGLLAFGVTGFILGPVVLALFVTLLRIYLEQRPTPPAHEQVVDRVLTRLAEADPGTPADRASDADEDAETGSGRGGSPAP